MRIDVRLLETAPKLAGVVGCLQGMTRLLLAKQTEGGVRTVALRGEGAHIKFSKTTPCKVGSDPGFLRRIDCM
jgi:hypothetical protein